MRVMLYFVAFGFLFAFIIPMLVGTFIREEDQIADRLRQGADPTEILEQTASGKADGDCETDGFRFLVTEDGYRYVQKQNNPYIAALMDNRITLLQIDEKEKRAKPIAESEPLPAYVADLPVVLSRCIGGKLTPAMTRLLLQAE
ncbi:hypothetical protein [Sedimenticola sp.]|uniref:hypothetical protein n=1 Tax=Sedimenticola sp. TaxID=1940285 RepID=UPI003D0F8404